MPETTSSERALEELRTILAEDDRAPGARLPTERELAARLAVNRATLRKALTRLEIEGTITRQVGRGTFLAAPRPGRQARATSASPVELMEARLTLEPVVAREAALRARQEDLQWLERCLDRSEATDDFASFEHWDIAFHRGLAQATQNPIFAMVMEVLRSMRSTSEWDRLKRASFTPALRDRYRAEHRAVLQALEQRSSMATAAAMFRHMQTVRAALSGGLWERPDPSIPPLEPAGILDEAAGRPAD